MKHIYSIRNDGYGAVQIRRNDDTEIYIVAILPIVGNGQFSTEQSRKTALRLAKKIIKCLNI